MLVDVCIAHFNCNGSGMKKGHLSNNQNLIILNFDSMTKTVNLLLKIKILQSVAMNAMPEAVMKISLYSLKQLSVNLSDLLTNFIL